MSELTRLERFAAHALAGVVASGSVGDARKRATVAINTARELEQLFAKVASEEAAHGEDQPHPLIVTNARWTKVSLKVGVVDLHARVTEAVLNAIDGLWKNMPKEVIFAPSSLDHANMHLLLMEEVLSSIERGQL